MRQTARTECHHITREKLKAEKTFLNPSVIWPYSGWLQARKPYKTSGAPESPVLIQSIRTRPSGDSSTDMSQPRDEARVLYRRTKKPHAHTIKTGVSYS